MRHAKSATLVALLAIGASPAVAADGRVRSACASDYLAYCSQHDPDGAGVRECMRANGPRLSQRCVSALVAAGEVEQPVLARKSKPKAKQGAEPEKMDD